MSGAAELTLLYRGPLSSCNYGCGYCPFAKHAETPAEAAADTAALDRFLGWVQAYPDPISVFFTPWGEALHRARYRTAIVALSGLPQLRRVAIQTNLAGSLDWLAAADRRKVGIWATYHPGEVTRERFLANCARLAALGVSHSVGVVGLRAHFAEIEALRAELSGEVPMWVNAYATGGGAPVGNYYSDDEVARLRAVDPLFEVGLRRLDSAGRGCDAGLRSLAIDGDGTARRCHFVPRVVGNLYADPLPDLLVDRPCPKRTCDCHIGYVWQRDLNAAEVYGTGLLERVPTPGADLTAYLDRSRLLARR